MLVQIKHLNKKQLSVSADKTFKQKAIKC